MFLFQQRSNKKHKERMLINGYSLHILFFLQHDFIRQLKSNYFGTSFMILSFLHYLIYENVRSLYNIKHSIVKALFNLRKCEVII